MGRRLPHIANPPFPPTPINVPLTPAVVSDLQTLIERTLNARVEGDRFTVGQATLSPARPLEIRQLPMIQTAHPDPPVGEIPRWRLSIQWRHNFSGVLVSDSVISRPSP